MGMTYEARYDLLLCLQMREELGVVPSMKLMDSIIDTCYSLIEKGFAVRKPGYRPRDEGHQ